MQVDHKPGNYGAWIRVLVWIYSQILIATVSSALSHWILNVRCDMVVFQWVVCSHRLLNVRCDSFRVGIVDLMGHHGCGWSKTSQVEGPSNPFMGLFSCSFAVLFSLLSVGSLKSYDLPIRDIFGTSSMIGHVWSRAWITEPLAQLNITLIQLTFISIVLVWFINGVVSQISAVCSVSSPQQMTGEHLARLLGVSRIRSGCWSLTEAEKQKSSYFRGWHVNQ